LAKLKKKSQHLSKQPAKSQGPVTRKVAVKHVKAMTRLQSKPRTSPKQRVSPLTSSKEAHPVLADAQPVLEIQTAVQPETQTQQLEDK
jgi:hypothetical protein